MATFSLPGHNNAHAAVHPDMHIRAGCMKEEVDLGMREPQVLCGRPCAARRALVLFRKDPQQQQRLRSQSLHWIEPCSWPSALIVPMCQQPGSR